MTNQLARYLDDAVDHTSVCEYCKVQRPCATATFQLVSLSRYWDERTRDWANTTS